MSKRRIKQVNKRYTSKAFRIYRRYIAFKHNVGIGFLIAEDIHMQMQETSIMRRMFSPPGSVFPVPEHTDRFLAWYAELPGEYDRNKLYLLPDGLSVEEFEEQYAAWVKFPP